jgi:hypothetical protein
MSSKYDSYSYHKRQAAAKELGLPARGKSDEVLQRLTEHEAAQKASDSLAPNKSTTSIYDSYSYHKRQAAAKKLGLPARGKSDEVLQRLIEHRQATQAQGADDICLAFDEAAPANLPASPDKKKYRHYFNGFKKASAILWVLLRCLLSLFLLSCDQGWAALIGDFKKSGKVDGVKPEKIRTVMSFLLRGFILLFQLGRDEGVAALIKDIKKVSGIETSLGK